MHKASCFGKRMICMLLCVLGLLSAAVPASAAMAELESVQEDRTAAAVHYNASFDSTVIGCVENGTELTVLDETWEFYAIDCFDMIGYIAREQVAVDDNGCYYVNCNEDSKETRTMAGRTGEEVAETVEQILALAEDQLGTPYSWGGTRPGGFDCSGYVMYLFTSMGYSINRTASQQLQNGLIVAREDLQPGDLVFFQGTSSESAISSHVGIYAGDGQFLHASNSGIRYDSLDSNYYSQHFLCARRIIVTSTTAYTPGTVPAAKNNRSSGQTGRSFLMRKCYFLVAEQESNQRSQPNRL